MPLVVLHIFYAFLMAILIIASISTFLILFAFTEWFRYAFLIASVTFAVGHIIGWW